MLERNGNVPVMAGGKHTCSAKFKAAPQKAWVEAEFPGEPMIWSIGIEAGETHRRTRFTPAEGDAHSYRYPLVELGLDRAACVRILVALWPAPVRKSSCVFCPFQSPAELADTYRNDPEAWDLMKQVEGRFRDTSPKKFQAWIDAGCPRTGKDGTGRAPNGMWSRDSWANGVRLITKRHDGRPRSLEEWEALIEAGHIPA